MDWKEALKVLAEEDICDPSKLKSVKLLGASSSFQYELYGCVNDEDGSCDVSGRMSVELQKLDIPHKGDITSTLKDLADGKALCVWMSRTLPWDLNLPMTTPLPSVPGFLQLFVICVGQPPLLLTLCDEGDDVTNLQQFTKDTASLLHWSLLDFCTLDIAILPCTLTHAEFSLASLAKAIHEKLSVLRKFFKSPLHLDPEMFDTLKVATRAQTGSTFVPCFLGSPETDKVWVFLMSEKWRNAVSLLIEHAHKEQRVTVSWEPDPSFSLKVVSLEVAKRLSFAQSCGFQASDENTKHCISQLKDHFSKNFHVELQMHNVKDVQDSSSYDFYINPQGETLSILIVGAPGSGKSSIANSILGDVLSTPKHSLWLKSVTFQVKEKIRFGVKIKIIESAGMTELLTSPEENTGALLMRTLTAMQPGPDVILFVIAVRRYTDENHRTYERLKFLLGEHVTDHTIVVLSHGDMLAGNEISDILLRAPPNFKQVLEECGHRYVVVDNTAGNTDPQAQEIVATARALKKQNAGRPYACPKYPGAVQRDDDEYASIRKATKKSSEAQRQISMHQSFQRMKLHGQAERSFNKKVPTEARKRELRSSSLVEPYERDLRFLFIAGAVIALVYCFIFFIGMVV